ADPPPDVSPPVLRRFVAVPIFIKAAPSMPHAMPLDPSSVVHRALAPAILSLILLNVGCGHRTPDYAGAGVAQASGTVTLDGEPLKHAVVRFYDPTRTRYAYAETDASGYYELQLNTDAAGVLPGEKIVVISTALSGPEVKHGGGPERAPARYNRDSQLIETVDPGGSHTFDFALTSDGEITEPIGGSGEEGDDGEGGR
ncbi:MAG: hypothetical protein AAF907_05990, partial [Planctomycetota bacterium]